MKNPFREKLDTARESIRVLKTPIGEPMKSMMSLCPIAEPDEMQYALIAMEYVDMFEQLFGLENGDLL